MRKIKYFIVLILLGSLVWYLFIKPYDYLVTFKANTFPGTINQTIKNALVDGLRWADMMSATRSGGFLMVLPETPVSSIESLADKLSSSIESQLKLLSSNFEYRLFFGHSCWQKHDDAQLLLARARSDLVEKMENAR
jgi:GGDEF domain-containing protein